jgi:glycosyltransferase involved in cell wall biosynthesis
MAEPAPNPRVSIVVEWENALLSEGDRSVAMLREVRRQAQALVAGSSTAAAGQAAPPLELLLVFDRAAFDDAALAALLDRHLGPEDDVLRWRVLPTRDGGYYRNKDLGARSAAGDIIVFLDSDVIPEPGWLQQILSGLDDPSVQIVAGSAYIDPAGLIGKVFALTWFFPLRSKNGPLRAVNQFFANNLAMRRDLYLQYPFPDLEETSRGACLVLASELAQANIAVYNNPRARVAHPAPNGIAHISKRALAQGRDRLYRERHYGSRWSASWPAACVRALRHCGGSAWKVCTNFRAVGLSPLLIPAAIAVAWYYYLLYWAGETLSQLRVPAITRVRV